MIREKLSGGLPFLTLLRHELDELNETDMTTIKPNTLPAGPHPGFSWLKSQPGVFRCKLWPATDKAKPEFADYRGTLQMSNGAKADVLLWVHADGTLGLRVAVTKPTPSTV